MRKWRMRVTDMWKNEERMKGMGKLKRETLFAFTWRKYWKNDVSHVKKSFFPPLTRHTSYFRIFHRRNSHESDVSMAIMAHFWFKTTNSKTFFFDQVFFLLQIESLVAYDTRTLHHKNWKPFSANSFRSQPCVWETKDQFEIKLLTTQT